MEMGIWLAKVRSSKGRLLGCSLISAKLSPLVDALVRHSAEYY